MRKTKEYFFKPWLHLIDLRLIFSQRSTVVADEHFSTNTVSGEKQISSVRGDKPRLVKSKAIKFTSVVSLGLEFL